MRFADNVYRRSWEKLIAHLLSDLPRYASDRVAPICVVGINLDSVYKKSPTVHTEVIVGGVLDMTEVISVLRAVADKMEHE